MGIPPPDMPPEYLAYFQAREYHVDLTVEHLHSFSGRVRIFADVSGTPRKVFYLHSTGLKISHASIGGVSAAVADELSVTNATRFELPIAMVGAIVMEVDFSGSISTRAPEGLSMLGQGTERRRRVTENRVDSRSDSGACFRPRMSSFPLGSVLGTHLEPTHARDLFPCIDLPSCKAVFHLTLRGVPAHLQAISNARVLRIEDYKRLNGDERASCPHDTHQPDTGGGAPATMSRSTTATASTLSEDVQEDLKTVVFHPTPIMPTYILGFWVGNFSSVTTQAFETESDRSAPLKCCGTPVCSIAPYAPGEAVTINVQVLEGASKDSARFALDFARRAFELFSRLFSVRFPLPKLDLLGLPRMHGLGMENFGAITLLEVCTIFSGVVCSAVHVYLCHPFDIVSATCERLTVEFSYFCRVGVSAGMSQHMLRIASLDREIIMD